MLFPDIPIIPTLPGGDAAPDFKMAAKCINFDLNSSEATNSLSTVKCSVPAGLGIGDSVQMYIDRDHKSAGSSDANASEDKNAKQPDIVMKSYWGSGDAVPEGQPKIIGSKATEQSQNANKDTSSAPQTLQVPDVSYAYWPGLKDKPLSKGASAVGDYALSANYCGTTSVSLAQDQDFLAPLEFVGITKTYDFSSPIELKWKAIPRALGYVVSAFGGNGHESITWTSSSDPDTALNIAYNSIKAEDVEKYLKSGVIMPGTMTSCKIPAGVFQDSPSIMVTITALGRDSAQDKDGITTQVIVRSIASVPLMAASSAKTTVPGT